MKKFLFLTAMVSLFVMSCQKSTGDFVTLKKEQKTIGGQSIVMVNGIATNGEALTSSNYRINVTESQQSITLGANVYCAWATQPMTVKINHWDYVNGHTPMQITGIDSFFVNGNWPTWYTAKRQTQFSYTGKMELLIYNDSLNHRLDYRREVLLTDSLGWTVNLDTTSMQQTGWVGGNRIADAVPKHYQ